MNHDRTASSLRAFVSEYARRADVFATIGRDGKSVYWPDGTLVTEPIRETPGSHRVRLNHRVLSPHIGHGRYRVPAASPTLRIDCAPGELDFVLAVVLSLLIEGDDSDIAKRTAEAIRNSPANQKGN